MEIVNIEEKENPFFNRKDLKLILKHPLAPTPSKSELKKELASRYNCDESQIVIDYIFTKKGACESLAKVKILKEKPKEKPKEEEKVEAQASENLGKDKEGEKSLS
jgi:ribosomal protein S24E